MIDLALLRSEPERVRESQWMRGDDVGVVDQVLAADAGAPRDDARHGFPWQALRRDLLPREGRALPDGDVGGGARGLSHRRDPGPERGPAAVRRVVRLLSARGRFGWPRHAR